jgi:hypothetical protein
MAQQCEGLRVGTKLEAIIEWPVLLDGRTPMQLVTILGGHLKTGHT